MSFYDKLQKLRKQNGLSQEQLAAQLNVSRQAISKWEQGTLPDMNNIINVSRYFDCSLDYLINENDESNKHEYDESKKEDAKELNNKKDGIKNKFKKYFLVLVNIIPAVAFIFIYILSKIHPSLIVRTTETGEAYVGITGFVDYHNLRGFMTLLYLMWLISFICIFIIPMIREKKQNSVTKKEIFRLTGSLMIILFWSYVYYEIVYTVYFAFNPSEIVTAVLYNLVALFLLYIRVPRKPINAKKHA